MRNIMLMLKNNFARNMGALILVIAGIFILWTSLDAGTLFLVNDTYDSTGTPVGLVCKEKSMLTDDLETYLADTLNMDLYTEETFGISEEKLLDKLMDLLINKEISAIIEVPEGFEKSTVEGDWKALTVTSLEDYENAAFLEIYLNTYMQKTRLLSNSANGDTQTFERMLKNSEAPVSEMKLTNKKALITEQQQSGFAISAGVFLMFSLGIAAVVALAVFDDRKTGTYNRMQISPVKPSEYIIGTTLSGIFLGVIFSLGLVCILLLKGIDPGLPIWLVAVITLLFTLFAVGFALIIALMVKNKTLIFAIILGATTIFCVLGGAWFPVDPENVLLSKIAALTPHYWFMEVIRNMQADPQFDFGPSILMLALFAALTYLISAALFTKKQ